MANLDPHWVGAEVVAIQEEESKVTARLVHVGGYVQVSMDSLRQIPVDFVTIPFQGTEVRLANVCPLSEEEGWSEEELVQDPHARPTSLTTQGRTESRSSTSTKSKRKM